MKNLVIGASGQVGRELMSLLGEEDTAGTAHTRAIGRMIPLDLADDVAVTRLIADLKPQFIYVPGGVTAVDWCEAHEAAARRICVDGSVAIRDAAQGIGARVVYFSTDYVFSGKSGPYSEDDPPDPISAYGRVKYDAERALGPGARILRTSMVYSDDPESKNFHNFVRNTLRAGKEVKAFSDQTGNPTYAPDLARAAVALMNGDQAALIHYAGPEVLTRLEFARRVARAYDLDENLVRPVTSEELPLAAARPKQGGLVLEVGPAMLNRRPVTVEMALREMKKGPAR